MEKFDDIQRLKEQILDSMDLANEIEDVEVQRMIGEHCHNYAREKMLTLTERIKLEQYLFHALRKLDILQELLEDEEIIISFLKSMEKFINQKSSFHRKRS